MFGSASTKSAFDFNNNAVISTLNKHEIEWKPATDDNEFYMEYGPVQVYILKQDGGKYNTIVYFGDYFLDLHTEVDDKSLEELQEHADKFVKKNIERLKMLSAIKFEKGV